MSIILFILFMSEFYTVWIIIPIFLFLILCWLFLAPLELQIDTRTPQASLRWISIGKAILVYESDKWWLRLNVLFFHKQWDLEKLILEKRKKTKRQRPRKKKKVHKTGRLKKFFNLAKSFRIIKWQLAMDTGDVIKNAWLYPLNFSRYTRQHLYINFVDENYLVMIIRNAPWKMAYAFLKK